MRMFVVLLALGLFFLPLAAEAMKPDPELFKLADSLLDKALAGYNAENQAAFYADWSEQMKSAGVCSEQAFVTLYIGMYKKQFGTYTSRELIEAETVLMPDSPVGLVVFKCVFEKSPSVKVSMNVTKEGETWKIMQIQFAPM